MRPYPELAGQRVQLPGHPEIYLIDDNGLRRWIPNPATYDNLFRDWNGVNVDIQTGDITLGHRISDGALLAKDPGTAPVWLIDHELHVKRWIASPAVMDKFYFNWAKIVPIPNTVLDAIFNGSNIT